MIHTVIMTICWICILCGIILGIIRLIGLLLRGILIAIAWCVLPREKPIRNETSKPIGNGGYLVPIQRMPIQRRYQGPPSFH
jgi:hypothetical protein